VLAILGVASLRSRGSSRTAWFAAAVAAGGLGTWGSLEAVGVGGVAVCWLATALTVRWLWRGPGLRFAVGVAVGHVVALASFVHAAGPESPGRAAVMAAAVATLALAARVARRTR